jgi:hypothetical protein
MNYMNSNEFGKRLKSFSSRLFTASSSEGFYRKPYRYSSLVLKLQTKKFAKQENSSLFMNSIL